MLTFALLRNLNDLPVYKDLYGERNKPEKNPEKLLLNYNKNGLPEFQHHFLCVLCDFLTDFERFSVVKVPTVSSLYIPFQGRALELQW